MAAKKVFGNLDPIGSMSDDDYFGVWRDANGDMRKITRANALNGLDLELFAARTAGNNDGATPSSLTDAITYAAGGIYNVLAYGAVGDGSNDDTTAIQAAIDAASTAGGGVVFFPAGTYKITAQLAVKSYVTLRGVGAKSIIDWRGTLNGIAMYVVDMTDVLIENLQVQNLSTVCGGWAIWLAGTSARIHVRNVRVIATSITSTISSIVGNGTTLTVNTTAAHGLSTGDSIHVYGTGTTYDLALGNITVADSDTITKGSSYNNGTLNTGSIGKLMWESAIYVASADSIVENCHISTGVHVGIRLAGASLRCKVTNNFISDVNRGMMVDGDGGDGARYHVITNNTFHGCKSAAIKIEANADYNLFAENIITDCSQDAYVDGTLTVGASYTSILNNKFIFTSAVAAAAIDMLDTGIHNIIQGNSIQGLTGGKGIYLHSDCQHIEILGNKIFGGTTGIEFGAGTTTDIMVIGNSIHDLTAYGIHVLAVSHFTLQNNMISAIDLGGIRLQNAAYYGSITGNLINGCGNHGIAVLSSVSPAKFVSITANVITNTDNLGTANDGIAMSANQENISIVGNVIFDSNAGDSIQLSNNQVNVTVVGNTTGDGLNLGSGGTVSAGNNY